MKYINHTTRQAVRNFTQSVTNPGITDPEVVAFYRRVERHMQKAKDDAMLGNKKLVIAMGEDHEDVSNLFAGATIMAIGRRLGMTRLLQELTAQDITNAQHRSISSYRFPHIPLKKHMASMAYGYRLVPADLDIPFTPENNRYLLSIEGIAKRENHFHQTILNQGQDCLFETGVSHMKFFLDEVHSGHLHVLAFVINHRDYDVDSMKNTDPARKAFEREREMCLRNDPRIVHLTVPPRIKALNCWQMLDCVMPKTDKHAFLKRMEENGNLQPHEAIALLKEKSLQR